MEDIHGMDWFNVKRKCGWRMESSRESLISLRTHFSTPQGEVPTCARFLLPRIRRHITLEGVSQAPLISSSA